jgi:hypothetical protein
LPKRASYERLEGESKKAFEAFVEYRNMGLDRSIAKVGAKLGKSVSLLERWSSKYSWVERAKEYDAEMDRKALLQQEKERKEMVKRHAKQAMMFQQKVLERIRSLNPNELTPSELIRWFETSVKIERLSRGESTEIQSIEHGGEVKETHEHNINQKIEYYTDVYSRAAETNSAAESHNESDDS